MDPAHVIANELADHWLEMMLAIPWSDHAKSIHDRAPFPCGETTSLSTDIGLMDVSDSYEWFDRIDGDIRLTIEVFGTDLDDPIARRVARLPRKHG